MLSRIDLTPASRPLLLPDETLLFVQNAVGLYEGKYKIPNYQNGSAYLTSHRACYVDNEDPRKFSVAVELKDVDRVEYYAGFLKSSPKITLLLKPPATTTATASNFTSSPGNRSAVSTPKSATPLIRPTSPSLASTGVWICPICSFSNPIPSNYIPQVTPVGSVPPCLACGIRPSPGVLESSPQQPPPRSPTPLSSLSPLYPAGSEPASSSATTATTTTGDSSEATFACPRCTFLNHPWLRSCEICGERLVSPDLPPEQLLEIAREESPAPTSISRKGGLIGENVEVVKFSFRAGGDKVFHERLKNALIQRKWLLQNAPPVPTPGQSSNGGASSSGGGCGATNVNGGTAAERVVGIAGLERAGLNMRKKNEAAIGGAFEDLEALMGRAKEMVALAEEFSTRLSSTPTFANSEAKAALRNSTQALGIVTKDMLTSATGGSNSSSSDKASDLYLSELARQMAEFLADDARGILKREGGVITLVDLWAIYNRARGIELISPSDLEKATGLFEKLKLPVRVRRFRSGLLVVQEARSSDAETVRRIMEWVAGPGWGRGVTAAQAAERFGWSIGVATEELEMAEERGALCREVGVEGVRFWKNWFAGGRGGL